MSSPDIDALFDFPCDFPIKVMGATHPEFRDTVVTVIREFDDQFDIERIETRPSSGGKYTGLTVTVRAQSRAAHLDDIYRALTGHPMVKVVL
ncbi:MAG: Proposed lipoate regulatory protein YbeD [uncultured Caballeronia sp.]|nr:MAG: Proposed lipoate regulatory protein YbeD [uncultured Caballeronia sp.]